MDLSDQGISSTDLASLHLFACNIAREAGDLTYNYFRRGVKVNRKEDDSPVTKADIEAEQLLRKAIEQEYPEHGIIGEEFDNVRTDARIQWILDPIDGTQSFIHGIPLYTTLIGIMVDDHPVSGIIYAPATREFCEAYKGGGARLNGKSCMVSQQDDLAKATLLSGDTKLIREYGFADAFGELVDAAAIHRTWSDAYGHMMVATGRAEIMFDPVLNTWDAAPLLTILTEAGGSYTDMQGKPDITGGNGLSCNKALASTVWDILGVTSAR
jgi:histidinol-phosphatase